MPLPAPKVPRPRAKEQPTLVFEMNNLKYVSIQEELYEYLYLEYINRAKVDRVEDDAAHELRPTRPCLVISHWVIVTTGKAIRSPSPCHGATNIWW